MPIVVGLSPAAPCQPLTSSEAALTTEVAPSNRVVLTSWPLFGNVMLTDCGNPLFPKWFTDSPFTVANRPGAEKTEARKRSESNNAERVEDALSVDIMQTSLGQSP